jgi:hypothetical protein
MTTKSKKQKISIMGVKYKVEKPISDTLKSMSDALHAHEVALLTWVHKDYSGKETKENINGFRNSLNEYCMNIPEAKNILKRMSELDQQFEQDKKDIDNKQKNQNKEEKVEGAKD